MTNETNRWITPEDLERELGFKKSNQAIYRMQRKIPYIKIGKYVRYDRNEITKWLEDHKVEVLDPLSCR